MKPKLSILIATQGRREAKFKQLLTSLMCQTTRDVEVIAYWNNGELPIGAIRQRLVEEAKGDYVCFVDDDDAVPIYYCSEILRALGEDYVGFQVKLFCEGVEMRPVFHDLQYQVWLEDDNGYYRGVTHLNPIKRSIALQGSFHENGAGEDASWAKSVLHLVKTQNYIDKVMYYYYHDKEDTSFGGDFALDPKGYGRPTFNYSNFRWHPASKLKGKGARRYEDNY